MLKAKAYQRGKLDLIDWDEIREKLVLTAHDLIDDAYSQIGDFPKKYRENILPGIGKFIANVEHNSTELTNEETEWLNQLRGLYWEMDDARWKECDQTRPGALDEFIASSVGRYSALFSQLVRGYLEPNSERDPLKYLESVSSRTFRIVHGQKNGKGVEIKIPDDQIIEE